jgi:sodium-dependent dicarboxylate transporter 2/3/5
LFAKVWVINLVAIGGTVTVLVGIAVAASAAMCLPISTPPNAIAFSTGLIKQNDMLKVGLSVGIVALVLGLGTLIVFGRLGIF